MTNVAEVRSADSGVRHNAASVRVLPARGGVTG